MRTIDVAQGAGEAKTHPQGDIRERAGWCSFHGALSPATTYLKFTRHEGRAG